MRKRGFQAATFLILPLLFFSPVGAESDAIDKILEEGIQATFSGDYNRADEIFSTIEQVDSRHPACSFYRAVVLFWRNSVDAGNPRYVDSIRKHLQLAMDQAERMLAADENDVEALHYMGLSFTYLGRLEAHNGRLYKGGVLGERGRKYLERAIEICQSRKGDGEAFASGGSGSCEDLYFPYGAYSYFAGRLPQLLKMFNFLWFIPSGSTEEGLAALERARANSGLHRLGATSLLVGIFLNFEADRIQDARKLSDALIQDFPDNPYLELQHANLLIAAGENRQAAMAADTILQKADRHLRSYDAVVRQGALLVKAEAAIREGNAAFARQLLGLLESEPIYRNNSLSPCTDLLLGMLADTEKKREEAVQYYQRARSYEGVRQNRIAARKAKQYLKEPYFGKGK